MKNLVRILISLSASSAIGVASAHASTGSPPDGGAKTHACACCEKSAGDASRALQTGRRGFEEPRGSEKGTAGETTTVDRYDPVHQDVRPSVN
jgi:hypothetical protein